MYNNFELLQKKCQTYHLKRMLKIVLPIASVLLVIIISLFSFLEDETEVVKIEKNDIKKEEKKNKIVIKTPKVVSEHNKKIDIEEEPDIFQLPEKNNKIEDVKYSLNSYSYNLTRNKKASIKKKEQVTAKKPIVDKKPKIEKSKKQDTQNKSFSIVLKNLDSMDKMIEVYNNEKTYPIALKIAKLFYDKKDYKNALLWSKKANNIDTRKEEAWLIYAKSEYALGNINRAKGILKVYINNSNSKEAKSLLISWIKG